ncbi:thiol:disulfide interchange protein DsbD [Marinimicrobium koreense]|uniref:Thiol:disulfide interchange protein DsbD n=1 Tax=Marinimicrobium koreense TaxID=306545 RepID=A0A3N1NYU8_9GAMM|nr:protein-disulfide reductase DsbD [Marinimicrobium koreense]ROQ19580.1 thiol:disulfide interchange protein DsbD [Marinimicrobium koreense]
MLTQQLSASRHDFLSFWRLLLWSTLLCVFSHGAAAQDLLGGQSQNTSLLGGGDDFLPVTEAFQLETRLYDGELVLHWEVAPDYYLYQERFRLSADPEPEPFAPRFSDNTVDKYDEYFEKDMAVYYGSATVRLAVADDAQPFTLKVESQGCADAGLCYPPHVDYVSVDPANQSASIASAPPANASANTDDGGATSEATTTWLPYILVLALLGGIILNLMPCVFPVLSIKVMSLARADRQRLPLHGWAYTAGIVVSFVAFAGVLLAARAGGEAIGWGFQLQSPLLIAALVYLFFILGLSLSGLLTIGTRWMGVGQKLTQSGGLSGSFFTGVLAAIVASPCTAPFMGAALGFALTQPTLVSLSVFVALGLGMALPLLALCYLPSLVNHLPKPGPWMDSLKQFLAFPLYLTAIWLLWVLGRQAGPNAVAAVGVGAVAIAFAGWLLTRQPRSTSARFSQKALVLLAWVAALALPWQTLNAPVEDSRWEPYSAARLDTLRREGTPVFINLTADWCLTCLANERVTLGTEDVERAFNAHGVATLKGDWTHRDPAITQLLEEYNRSGVPLYLWFPADHQGPGIVLPQILRKKALLERLDDGTETQLSQN